MISPRQDNTGHFRFLRRAKLLNLDLDLRRGRKITYLKPIITCLCQDQVSIKVRVLWEMELQKQLCLAGPRTLDLRQVKTPQVQEHMNQTLTQ